MNPSYTTPQITAINEKLRDGKVKNRYAAKTKVKKIRKNIAHFKWLAQ